MICVIGYKKKQNHFGFAKSDDQRIQKETKKASSNQAESILPEVVEATTHLADLILRFYQ